MKKIIGITGSIGSGKTYCTTIFNELCFENNVKADFFDVDNIRREILKSENINRDFINSKIYAKTTEMDNYKKFIVPKIRKQLEQDIENHENIIFIEWALLLEDKLYDLVDCIIMIDCIENVQLRRLEKGDLGIGNVKKRMNLQLSNRQKIEKIEELNLEKYIIDTTNSPGKEEYDILLKKVGVYE